MPPNIRHLQFLRSRISNLAAPAKPPPKPAPSAAPRRNPATPPGAGPAAKPVPLSVRSGAAAGLAGGAVLAGGGLGLKLANEGNAHVVREEQAGRTQRELGGQALDLGLGSLVQPLFTPRGGEQRDTVGELGSKALDSAFLLGLLGIGGFLVLKAMGGKGK